MIINSFRNLMKKEKQTVAGMWQELKEDYVFTV